MDSLHIGTQGQSVSVTLVSTVTSSGLHVPESSPVHTCSLSPSPAPAIPNQVNFKSMLYSVNGRPVYRSLPRTVPGSLELLTCLYLLSSFLTILLIDSWFFYVYLSRSWTPQPQQSCKDRDCHYSAKLSKDWFQYFTHLWLLSTISHLQLINKPSFYSLTCLCLAPSVTLVSK